jgi:CofD-related protein of GAK system
MAAARPEAEQRQHLILRHRVAVPDPLRIARCERAPELGPRILFFSGGTALKRFSKRLIRYTHRSVHIITPFDSGGSSAEIRRAFGMLSIGDLRNRLMALADQSVKGNPEIYRLFSYRMPTDEAPDRLRGRLRSLADGCDALSDGIPLPMQSIICRHLDHFLQCMPRDFDLRGANIGNLVLTAGYLSHQRQIETVIYLFARLVKAQGHVRPVVTDNLHLGTTLRDGRTILGQHRITGVPPSGAGRPIGEIFLSASPDTAVPVQPSINAETAALIEGADLICYPMGSFYTSIVANLLPAGVGRAVAASGCPKVFIPNTLPEPELFSLSLPDMVRTILRCLQKDGEGKARDYLDWILLDNRWGRYPYELDLPQIRSLGVGIIDTALITSESAPYIDPVRLCGALLSLT